MSLLAEKHTIAVPVTACDLKEAQEKGKYLSDLSNLSISTLKLLAEKSRKPGIEKKLEQYKNLI